MAHGTLPPGAVSLAVTHRTVAEIWFVTGGAAEVWRKGGGGERVLAGDEQALAVEAILTAA